jgi:hypothetical protein
LQAADDLLGDRDQPVEPRGELRARLGEKRSLHLHKQVGWMFGTEYMQLDHAHPRAGHYETAVVVGRRLLGEPLSPLSPHRHGATAGRP